MPTQSQLREAICDTLLTQAEGTAFDKLVASYGFPRPHYIPRAGWRKAMLACVFGKRGTLGCLQAFLEGALERYADTGIEVVLDPALPTTLTTTGAWTDEHVGRLVRVPSYGLYRIISRSSAYVVLLCPIETLHWNGADFSTLAEQVTVADAMVLAFEVQIPTPGPQDPVPEESAVDPREPAVARVLVWASTLTTVPPTYLLEDGEERDAAQPFGGAILADATIRVFSFETASGPVASVEIGDPGSGYTILDVLTIDAGGVNATVGVANVGGGGEVLAVILLAKGSSYTVADDLPTTGGTGTLCTINVLSFDAGVVTFPLYLPGSDVLPDIATIATNELVPAGYRVRFVAVA